MSQQEERRHEGPESGEWTGALRTAAGSWPRCPQEARAGRGWEPEALSQGPVCASEVSPAAPGVGAGAGWAGQLRTLVWSRAPVQWEGPGQGGSAKSRDPSPGPDFLVPLSMSIHSLGVRLEPDQRCGRWALQGCRPGTTGQGTGSKHGDCSLSVGSNDETAMHRGFRLSQFSANEFILCSAMVWIHDSLENFSKAAALCHGEPEGTCPRHMECRGEWSGAGEAAKCDDRTPWMSSVRVKARGPGCPMAQPWSQGGLLRRTGELV